MYVLLIVFACLTLLIAIHSINRTNYLFACPFISDAKWHRRKSTICLSNQVYILSDLIDSHRSREAAALSLRHRGAQVVVADALGGSR